MAAPTIFGLAVISATVFLVLIVAWASMVIEFGPDSAPTRSAPSKIEESGRTCPLCGSMVTRGGDAGCPIIEALGVVMTESKRSIADGPSSP